MNGQTHIKAGTDPHQGRNRQRRLGRWM